MIDLTEKKGIDLEHLTIIDESEVPAKQARYTPYRELLKRIKKGRALVLSENEVNIHTVRAGILRLRKRGEFKRIMIRQRRDTDGIRKLYVINPSDEDTEKKYRAVPPHKRQQGIQLEEKKTS